MEAISETPQAIEVFFSGNEYFVVLRPDGMLATAVAQHPDLSTSLQGYRSHFGYVLRVTPEVAPLLLAAQPAHACDDRLRLMLARWLSSLPPHP